ncbi:hypothetical protein ASE01_16650 [Nocardioides sp. Root190]|uniref:SCO7613 C-terminal domain-containing membrane protein n=1 Tax=Nocardioides sp. Root190 TaxID=1736488 RepID=UPI0006FEE14E|nr:hypothetical protein [Nocardioides sp. Root190]KRB74998.1 hypothetical protein ASE01_16650 [Nocardioides sp. Root190]
MRYADPALCPDCRSSLPSGVPVCPTCDLLVRHPLAVDLFRTLRRADELVVDLRAATDAFHDRPTAVEAGVPEATRVSSLGGPLVPPSADPLPKLAPVGVAPPPLPPTSYPPADGPRPERSGVLVSSVPKILLGLGAFCLLVAAVIFLAVSWSALGVGGRTAVLGGFTLTASTSALLLHRAGLRVAGESLIVVALGMLALDVFGAGAAGWFGAGGDGGITLAAGLVVAVAAVVLSVVRIGDQPRLVAPQVIAGIALLVGYAGAVDTTDHRLIAGHLLTGAAILTVLVGRAVGLPVLQWSTAAAGAIAWFGAASLATSQALIDPDLHRLWSDGNGWSLLVTASAMLVPGLVVRHQHLLLAGASCAAMVVTVVLTLPSVDTDASTLGIVALSVTAAWVVGLAVLPRLVRVIAIAPAAAGSLILIGLSLTTAAVALVRWAESTRTAYAEPFDLILTGSDPATEPLLLVPSVLVVLAFVALLPADRGRSALAVWARVAAIAVGLGGATTLTSYDVALALPVAVLVLTAAVSTTFALTTKGAQSVWFAASAASLAAVASIAALPSDVLGAAVGAMACAVALVLAVIGREAGTRVVGRLAVSPLVAMGVAAAVHVAGGDAAWVSLPVLLAVGVLAVAFASEDVEIPAALTASVLFPVSLAATADPGGYTALWLAVLGFLVCATALVNKSRRGLAWLGGVLLLLATWVRLFDLDVFEPEPYTLPLAAGLVALGLWRMQHSPAVGTAEALLPGLLLATVPSLLWVLDDPVSLRALVLGAACLALTVAGAALRWSAPLLVGASIGAAIVFRELGPYAGDFPKWVWIGLAGALLTVVGITWERRLLEVRKAVGLLGRLR